MSIDENSIARLERLSFDVYNESVVLINSIEEFFGRTGHYIERVLVDQIYRNRKKPEFLQGAWHKDVRTGIGKAKTNDTVSKQTVL